MKRNIHPFLHRTRIILPDGSTYITYSTLNRDKMNLGLDTLTAEWLKQQRQIKLTRNNKK